MQRLYFVLFVWLVSCFVFSCSTAAPNLFAKQTLHEQYGKKLTDAGLNETAIGRQWFTASQQALQSPVAITIPYKEFGYFAAEKPRAVGLKFRAKRGEKLTVQLSNRSASANFKLYADVWKVESKAVLIKSFDSTTQTMELEAEDDSNYIIRLQPELLASGEYSVSIAVGPSLAMPVAGTHARIGSVWGDARDAGARRHEGIDIFAPKHTPALAAADGVITAVNENTLGGKTVWLRPNGKSYTLYYAHLDEQLVSARQRVRKGDTVGLVGNTGNARTTPSHLHFGIYTFGGAINPLPFVNPAVKKPQAVDSQLFKMSIRLAGRTTVIIDEAKTDMKANTFAAPLAINATSYRVQFPDGRLGSVPIKSAESASRPLRNAILKDTSFLLEEPQPESIRKVLLNPAATVSLVGVYKDYALVQTKEGIKGWLLEKDLK